MPPLNARQRAFVAAYLKDPNATKAAIAAGYSKNGAASKGSQLYRNVKIRAAIDAALNRVGVTSEVVLGELLRLARCDLSLAFNEDGTLKKIHDIPEDVRRAISGWEQEELYEGADGEKFSLGRTKKVKFWDKTKALELLGKHLKLFTEKVEHSLSTSLEALVLESMGKSPK